MPRSTTGWMETYGMRLKYQGVRVFSHFRCRATSAVGGTCLLFRVMMSACNASASGNSDRDTLRGSFIHRFNGAGECGNQRTRHADTKTAPLRAIVSEIDVPQHASCTKKFGVCFFSLFFSLMQSPPGRKSENCDLKLRIGRQ